ncbi:hypothetical protein CTAM01_02874, partial [Colletotrichum tamarilloi]
QGRLARLFVLFQLSTPTWRPALWGKDFGPLVQRGSRYEARLQQSSGLEPHRATNTEPRLFPLRLLVPVIRSIPILYASPSLFSYLTSTVETCIHDHGQSPLHRGLGKPDTNGRDWQMASARLLQQIKLVRVRPVLQLCICICIASWSTLASGCGYLDDPSSQPNLKTSSHTSCIRT